MNLSNRATALARCIARACTACPCRRLHEPERTARARAATPFIVRTAPIASRQSHSRIGGQQWTQWISPEADRQAGRQHEALNSVTWALTAEAHENVRGVNRTGGRKEGPGLPTRAQGWREEGGIRGSLPGHGFLLLVGAGVRVGDGEGRLPARQRWQRCVRAVLQGRKGAIDTKQRAKA